MGTGWKDIDIAFSRSVIIKLSGPPSPPQRSLQNKMNFLKIKIISFLQPESSGSISSIFGVVDLSSKP